MTSPIAIFIIAIVIVIVIVIVTIAISKKESFDTFASRSNVLDWYAIPGQDDAGFDIAGNPIHGETQHSCIRQCINNNTCVAASYNPSSGDCFLKNGANKISPNAAIVYLVPPIPQGSAAASMNPNANTDHSGDDLGCFTGVPVSACGAVCAAAGGNCNSYVGNAGGCCVNKTPVPIITGNQPGATYYK